MLEKSTAVANKNITVSQPSLFDFVATRTEGDRKEEMELRQVSEPKEPYCVETKDDVYSVVLPLLLAATAKKGQTQKALRKSIDPDGYFSPKGWKLLLDKACAEGKLARTEKPKKRGKPDVFYVGIPNEVVNT